MYYLHGPNQTSSAVFISGTISEEKKSNQDQRNLLEEQEAGAN